MIANAENLVRKKRLMSLAAFAVTLVAVQVGTAFASGGSACVLTNAQATSILGSASHVKARSGAECIYSSSSSRIEIDKFFPVHKYPSVPELKKLTGATSITTLHGIGDRADLVKVKRKAFEIVSLYFAVGDSFYMVSLIPGDRKSVPKKQIMLLEAAVTVAAKKL